MIVQCHGCKTRFRIADEKVAGRGVRVRCTKCGDTFVVRPAAAEPPPAAVPGATPAPPAAPAPPASPPAPATPPAEAPAAAVAPGAGDPDLDGPSRPTGAAGVGDLFGDLDLDGDGGGNAPLGGGPVGGGLPPPTEADVDAALASLDDGLGGDVAPQDLGLAPGETLRAGAVPDLDAPDPRASAAGAAAGGVDPGLDLFGVGSPPAAPDPFALAGGGGEDAAPFGTGGAPKGPGGPDGDGGWAAGGPLELDAAPPAEATVPGAAAQAPDPFEGVDPFGGAGPAAGWEDGGAAADGAAGAAPDPFAVPAGDGAAPEPSGLDLDLDLGGPPGAGAAFETAGPVPAFEGNAAPAAALDDDPFASLDTNIEVDTGPDPFGGGPALDLRGEAAGPAEAPAPTPAAEAAPTAGVAAPRPRPRVAAGRDTAPDEGPTLPRRRSTGAVVAINALFGVALVCLLLGAFVAERTGGGFTPTVFTPARLRRAFTGGGASGLSVAQFANGLYPTATGGRVLVVRGVVENHGSRPVSPGALEVRLVAGGGRVVARATGVVGASPTAPQVYRLDGPAAATALLATLRKRAPATVKPHGRAPFFAVIPSWQGDLHRMRFVVRVGGGK